MKGSGMLGGLSHSTRPPPFVSPQIRMSSSSEVKGLTPMESLPFIVHHSMPLNTEFPGAFESQGSFRVMSSVICELPV